MSISPTNKKVSEDLIIRQVNRRDLPDLEWDGEYIFYRRLYKEIFENAPPKPPLISSS